MNDVDSSSTSNDKYILNPDLTASICLNSQHYLWQQELGYTIHPSIPISSLLGSNARIADIATGTGAWLLDVSRAYPTATCDGFDIDPTQTPPTPWLPQNVSFFQWNMLEPPPAELAHSYDMVHFRLVKLVLANGNPVVSTMRNLAALLKPKGYIQWDEIDLGDSLVAHASGDGGK